jgi:predicted DNA-binding transcriptional regulator YafY
MATNKNALLRYKVLDNCFRNSGRKYFIEDLISECENVLLSIDLESSGISRRQIFEDIAFMESAEGWSIELERIRDGRRVFYRYSDMSFSINKMPLNELEINQLMSAIGILSQFEGMPQFEWMNELIPKLKQGINSEERSSIIMDFDSNQYLKGREYLGELYNAVFYKKVLCVCYKPFESENSFEMEIHPYFLKQFNNRWFLFGYNSEREKYDWNLALDRIESIKEVRKPYNKNNNIDWQEYFEDLIGVTKPEDAFPQDIILHFTGRTGYYIETKPLHGSQKARWIDENTLEVRLHVIINYELQRLLLSYSDSIIIVQPSELSDIIKEKLNGALQNFNS